MTEPLTPPDCDLRDFPSMLLDVARLRDSTLASSESGDAFRAAVLLWAASWHQVPAGSVPADDCWIATTAGYALRGKIDRGWLKVRDGALRKFVKCTDGRLYHPVVCEKALECWLSKLAARLSSGAGNAKKHNISFDPKPIEAQIALARGMLSALNPHSRALTRRKHTGASPESRPAPDGSPAGSPLGSQEKDKGREGITSVPIGTGGEAPPAVDNSPTAKGTDTARRAAWRDCGKWLMANGLAESTAREAMGKLLKDWPQVALDAMRTASTAPSTPNPVAYLNGIAKRLAEGAKGSLHPVPTAEETAAEAARRAEAAASPSPEARAKLAQLSGRAAA